MNDEGSIPVFSNVIDVCRENAEQVIVDVYLATYFLHNKFAVSYAGLVRDIRGDIDPSGRTDLLKILDRAKIRKQIESFDDKNRFAANAILQIDLCSITIRSFFENELLLYVPIHLIASVGFIREAHEYILPVKMGYSSARNRDFFDLAVLYCETSDVAETVCNVLGQCFSQVYKEIASNFETSAASKKTPTISSVSSPSNHRPLFLTESHQDLRIGNGHPPCSTTASHSGSAEIQIDDVIEDYMIILTKCLTTSELSQYASLIVRFRNGSMPIIELAQKSSELYGPDRLHLLTSMRCLLRNRNKEEIDSFDSFIEMLRLSSRGLSSE